MKRRWRSTTMLPHVRQQTKKNSLNWLGWVRFDKDVTPLHSVLRVARTVETILTMNHSSSLNDCENVLFFCTPSSRARAKQIATKITHKDRNFDMRREKKNRLVWQLSDVEKSSSCDDKSPLRSNILQFAFLAFDLLKRNKKKLFARLLALFVHSLFDYHDTTSDSRVSIWLLFFVCTVCSPPDDENLGIERTSEWRRGWCRVRVLLTMCKYLDCESFAMNFFGIRWCFQRHVAAYRNMSFYTAIGNYATLYRFVVHTSWAPSCFMSKRDSWFIFLRRTLFFFCVLWRWRFFFLRFYWEQT